jgi:hypothetical protein
MIDLGPHLARSSILSGSKSRSSDSEAIFVIECSPVSGCKAAHYGLEFFWEDSK